MNLLQVLEIIIELGTNGTVKEFQVRRGVVPLHNYVQVSVWDSSPFLKRVTTKCENWKFKGSGAPGQNGRILTAQPQPPPMVEDVDSSGRIF